MLRDTARLGLEHYPAARRQARNHRQYDTRVHRMFSRHQAVLGQPRADYSMPENRGRHWDTTPWFLMALHHKPETSRALVDGCNLPPQSKTWTVSSGLGAHGHGLFFKFAKRVVRSNEYPANRNSEAERRRT